MRLRTLAFFSYFVLVTSAFAQNATDFSGEWRLNTARSEIGNLPSPPDTSLRVDQSAASVTVFAMPPDGAPPVTYLYPLDGRTEKRKSSGLELSTQTKWEGAALLANTLASGAQSYTIMERWTRSASGTTLTIRKTVVSRGSDAESILVYERPGAAAQRPTLSESAAPEAVRPQLVNPPQAPQRSMADEDFVVTAGTRVLLHLRNSVNTKHSAPGDRVYLETSMPVFVNQHMVIPTGSYVIGTVTESQRAGKVKGLTRSHCRTASLATSALARVAPTPPPTSIRRAA